MKRSRWFVVGVATLVCAMSARAQSSMPATVTTAWNAGSFHVNEEGVVGRSDIVLEHANAEAAQAMPLGNGRLGAAVWSAEGMTAQLNRSDTMPRRLSAGQLVIPGLRKLTQAKDYAGRLDLYRGSFVERGGGMSALAYVEPKADALVVDVTGADPKVEQTVELRLWEPRTPTTGTMRDAAWFAESWLDNKEPGASGEHFGSLAVVSADGANVRATVTNKRTLTLRFLPHANGRFRVMVAAPHFDGTTEPQMAATRALTDAGTDLSVAAHAAWWRAFWKKAAMIRVTSADGVGDYMENLRTIYLYVAACERGEKWPGSQAGVADMISSARDTHKWDPAAFWHWNTRMQVAANLGAGLWDLNLPYFDLYRENLPDLYQWTRDHMHNMDGVCVPETMRFNGKGYEYEGSWTPPVTGLNCDLDSKPYYNARTQSTGAEIGVWVWRQYLTTDDDDFLEKYFPIMDASARFLLAAQHQGEDGLLHTFPSNAHENQWDVVDPTTDLSAIKALYPMVIEATQLLDQDHNLAFGLQTALKSVPAFPRVGIEDRKKLVPPSADAEGKDVIADSYRPAAEIHNVENIGLEPVWPYGLIGDRSDEFPLAVRTYENRLNKMSIDWSYDPVQAARLDMGSQVGETLKMLTEVSQNYPNGMAKWGKEDTEFYVEQTGVTALALQEMLVQDYDGVLRIAPAVPPGWDVDGSVWVRGKMRVDVQTRNGRATTVVLEPGLDGDVTLRNPWPGEGVAVLDGKTGKTVKTKVNFDLLSFSVRQKVNYLVRPLKVEGRRKFEAVTGTAAQAPKRLGPVQIGVF
ncbi:MAG TPA: hypothetical protein VG844_16670 [Terracidiphilus sp.]|nr:hypothetical protein [Terracidiphilus sp.]